MHDASVLLQARAVRVATVKRRIVVIALVVLFVAIVLALVIQRPRRPRPEGFDAPWASLPETIERDWSTDVLKRGVIQDVFSAVSEELQHCNMELYRLADGDVVKADLLFEQQAAGMQLMFVRMPERPTLPPLLLPCFEQALERSRPVPNTGLAVGTRWRLGVHMLIHPVADLPPEPWWHRFVPQSWRSGGDSVIHVG